MKLQNQLILLSSWLLTKRMAIRVQLFINYLRAQMYVTLFSIRCYSVNIIINPNLDPGEEMLTHKQLFCMMLFI